jgi:hypothetical protein
MHPTCLWYDPPPMKFEYEITADQHASAQLLYRKLKNGHRSAIHWILLGIILIAIAWMERPFNLANFLTAAIGATWIYSGIVSLSPWYFRRAYSRTDLAGKKYEAEVNETGFDVTGDQISWQVKWPAVRVKGENERLFLFYSHGTLFVFSKVFLKAEEQDQLRQFSGLAQRASSGA